VLATSAFGASPAPPALVFESQVAQYGETYAFASVEGQFDFTNRSAREVHIRTVTAQAVGGRVVAAPTLLRPGERGRVVVHQELGARLGQSRFRFDLESDDPDTPTYKLLLTGFVQSAYDPESGSVDFGSLERKTAGARELRVGTREAGHLSVLAVEDAPAWLAVEALPGDEASEVRLRLTLRAGAPLGAHAARVRLRTDLERQPWFELGVRAALFEGARLDPPQANLGLLRVGQASSTWVELRRDDGGPAGLLGAEGLPPWLRVAEEACAPVESACRRLRLTAQPTITGAASGSFRLRLLGAPEPVEFPFAALVVEATREVRELELPADASSSDAGPASVPIATEAPPASSPASAPVRTPGQITVAWKARRDSQAFGYLVYRAERREGPFQRLNAQIVRVPADGAEQHAYFLVDRQVRGAQTYYYYVDMLTLEGRKQRFSGVLSRVAPADAS
jgi:hypothetical protein